MSFCKKCGAEIKDGEKVCSACGQAVEEKNAVNDVVEEIKKLNDTKDTTADYTEQEINEGKGLSVVAYLSILVLIPIFLNKNNKFVSFHTNQGLVLLLCSIVIAVVNGILEIIPVVGGLIGAVLSLAQIVLMIIGIINAAQGKAKELPVIGKITILK